MTDPPKRGLTEEEAVAYLKRAREAFEMADTYTVEARKQRVQAIRHARKAGMTWASIAGTLGITKTAAINIEKREAERERAP